MLKKGVEGQEMPLSANEIFRPLRGDGGGTPLADGFSD